MKSINSIEKRNMQNPKVFLCMKEKDSFNKNCQISSNQATYEVWNPFKEKKKTRKLLLAT